MTATLVGTIPTDVEIRASLLQASEPLPYLGWGSRADSEVACQFGRP
jgi:hypothetical protein